jgi:Aldehyde dehydrogenase family
MVEDLGTSTGSPVNLSVIPATAALAAGNRVLLKAPEATRRTSELLARLAGQYFSPEELVVITGGPAVGTAFCAMGFDHLLFTGSTHVAKHVQRSAAEHLVPVAFELGGKNPVVVDRDADIAAGASRTAPDYVFVPANRCDEFVAAAERQFRASFPTVTGNPDFCSIIDDKDYQPVVCLMRRPRQGRKGHRGDAGGRAVAVGCRRQDRAHHPDRGNAGDGCDDRRGVRAGAERAALPEPRRGHRLHQRPAVAARGLLDGRGLRRLPSVMCPYAQRRGHPQRPHASCRRGRSPVRRRG